MTMFVCKCGWLGETEDLANGRCPWCKDNKGLQELPSQIQCDGGVLKYHGMSNYGRALYAGYVDKAYVHVGFEPISSSFGEELDVFIGNSKAELDHEGYIDPTTGTEGRFNLSEIPGYVQHGIEWSRSKGYLRSKSTKSTAKTVPKITWTIYEDYMEDGNQTGNEYTFVGTPDEVILHCIRTVEEINKEHPEDTDEFSFWGVEAHPGKIEAIFDVGNDRFKFFPGGEVEWIGDPKYRVGKIASKPVRDWSMIVSSSKKSPRKKKKSVPKRYPNGRKPKNLANYICPHCGKQLYKEPDKSIDYPLVCTNCDENFYTIECEKIDKKTVKKSQKPPTAPKIKVVKKKIVAKKKPVTKKKAVKK